MTTKMPSLLRQVFTDILTKATPIITKDLVYLELSHKLIENIEEIFSSSKSSKGSIHINALGGNQYGQI